MFFCYFSIFIRSSIYAKGYEIRWRMGPSLLRFYHCLDKECKVSWQFYLTIISVLLDIDYKILGFNIK